IHGGSIRADLAQGNITVGGIISVLPFNNSLAVVEASIRKASDTMEQRMGSATSGLGLPAGFGF
ncbi:MAG: 5'-nucleotidase C-terminal domain-containing protein, partial [Clostridia bacterium]|nr:5'-nucleotidase C-terminal domain-containing protein [Clostridia bacterium]